MFRKKEKTDGKKSAHFHKKGNDSLAKAKSDIVWKSGPSWKKESTSVEGADLG